MAPTLALLKQLQNEFEAHGAGRVQTTGAFNLLQTIYDKLGLADDKNVIEHLCALEKEKSDLQSQVMRLGEKPMNPWVQKVECEPVPQDPVVDPTLRFRSNLEKDAALTELERKTEENRIRLDAVEGCLQRLSSADGIQQMFRSRFQAPGAGGTC